MHSKGLVHRGFKHIVRVCVMLCVFTEACAHRNSRSSQGSTPRSPSPPLTHASLAPIGLIETGIASWYGDPYHGRRAASGEIFDKEKLTAAHRTLPFETWLEVTNLENGKRVIVRIIDRGPFVAGRIIDLSQAAGREVDLIRLGVAKVSIRVIDPPDEQTQAASRTVASVATAPFAVQAGAFADRARAELLSLRMAQEYGDSRVIAGPNALWRVIVGRALSHEQAAALAGRITANGTEAALVAEPF